MGVFSVMFLLSAKKDKHNKIKILADSKFNTIEEYVSQAIADGSISHEEFLLVNGEIRKFNEGKNYEQS